MRRALEALRVVCLDVCTVVGGGSSLICLEAASASRVLLRCDISGGRVGRRWMVDGVGRWAWWTGEARAF